MNDILLGSQLRKRHEIKMLRLVIFVSILSLVHGMISIESQPAIVVNRDFVKLICDVGTMENTVKWVYDGVTYFSCDPPYTNCFTNTSVTNDGYYDFSIKDNSIIMILRVSQYKNDGNWSCYHGNEKSGFKMDIKDQVRITSFSIPRKDTSGEYKFQCDVESELPVDVTIYASYQGERILYEVKQSSLSIHSVSSTLRCSEIYFYCNVTNGYGPIFSRGRTVNVECPLKILHDLLPKTTVSLNDISSTIKIYYEGFPSPLTSLYRLGADDIPEGNSIYVHVGFPTKTEPASVNFYASKVKTGKYMLILKQGNIKEVVYFNFINSTPSTTVSPTNTSTIDTKGKTTNQAEHMITAEETMIYLGVAGFVMFLMLILILVIVGVIWFIRIKRKPAGSMDQNQVQTPNNRPDHIYEDLKK